MRKDIVDIAFTQLHNARLLLLNFYFFCRLYCYFEHISHLFLVFLLLTLLTFLGQFVHFMAHFTANDMKKKKNLKQKMFALIHQKRDCNFLSNFHQITLVTIIYKVTKDLNIEHLTFILPGITFFLTTNVLNVQSWS